MRVHIPFLNSTRGRRALLSAFILAASLGVSSYLVFSPPGGRGGEAAGADTVDQTGVTSSQNLDFVRLPSNLTQEFTDRAVEKLVTENATLKESGITDPKDFSLLPGEADVSSIVSNIIDSELASEEVKESDLAVNKLDTKEIQIAYLIFINQMLETEGGEMPDVTSSPLTSYFADTAAKLDEVVEILKAVSVPPSWLSIHRDLVAFFTRERNIFRSLGAADTDPLRFMIASTRLVPEDAEREFQKIQTAINQKIIDEGLI
jgi:hypothetical protein